MLVILSLKLLTYFQLMATTTKLSSPSASFYISLQTDTPPIYSSHNIVIFYKFKAVQLKHNTYLTKSSLAVIIWKCCIKVLCKIN